MSCKHCSGPILLTKIVSTLGDFQDRMCRCFRLGITSARPTSGATRMSTTGRTSGRASLWRRNGNVTATGTWRCTYFILHTHPCRSLISADVHTSITKDHRRMQVPTGSQSLLCKVASDTGLCLPHTSLLLGACCVDHVKG